MIDSVSIVFCFLKKLENDASLPSPKINQPTFVNVTHDDDETNLEVTNSPSDGHQSAITNKTAPVTDASRFISTPPKIVASISYLLLDIFSLESFRILQKSLLEY